MNVPFLHSYLTYRHYPAIYGKHIHSELASIHHDELLREQSELERCYRINQKLFAIDKMADYEAVIRDKQLRLRQMVDRSRLIHHLQRDRLEGIAVEEQLRRQQILRQMQVDRYLMINQPLRSTLDQRRNISLLSLEQQRLDKQTDQFKVIQSTSEKNKPFFSSLKKQESTDQRSHLLKAYEFKDVDSTKGHRGNQDVFKNELINQHLSRKSNLKEQKHQSKNPYLSHRKGELESGTKRKRQKVTFSLDQTAKTNRSRISERSNEVLFHPTPSASIHKGRTSVRPSSCKRIEQRLQLSEAVYRDARWRNKKHEGLHLFNTYQTEVKLRQEIKAKINSNPKVIERYSIVVQRK